jgi:hypothetical protein
VDSNVRADEGVEFTQRAKSDNERFFRRIVWWGTKHQRGVVFRTNHVDFDVASVAAGYRQSSQTELLFKVLRRELKIKIFAGTSEFAAGAEPTAARPSTVGPELLRGAAPAPTFRLSRHLRFPDNPFEGEPPLRKDYIAPQPSLF